jgi:hypothetical protein
MIGDKKLYLYSGLAIALSVVAYVVITNKKKLDEDPSNDNNSSNSSDVTTSTGDIITTEQALIEKNLQEILNMSISNAKSKLLDKNIFTKLDNVTPRTTPNVNNGVFNNSYGGKIVDKNTKIGIVKDIVEDSGKLKNPQGNVYKWLKVLGSKEAIDSINKTKSLWNTSLNNGTTFYVREDVIKL